VADPEFDRWGGGYVSTLSTGVVVVKSVDTRSIFFRMFWPICIIKLYEHESRAKK